jgi:hypothetical protein
VVAGYPRSDGSSIWPHVEGERILRAADSPSLRREPRGRALRDGRLVEVIAIVEEGSDAALAEDWIDPRTGLSLGGRRGAAPAEADEREETDGGLCAGIR